MIGSRNPIDIFLKTKVNRARGGYRIASRAQANI
jgi:hypothetical protein